MVMPGAVSGWMALPAPMRWDMPNSVRDSDWLVAMGIVADISCEPRGISQMAYEGPASPSLYVDFSLYVGFAWRITKRPASSDDVAIWYTADFVRPI